MHAGQQKKALSVASNGNALTFFAPPPHTKVQNLGTYRSTAETRQKKQRMIPS